KVKLGEIDIIRDYPSDLPKLKANLTQLEEVLFNLIDNAYDAMKERKDTLKEPDYRGKITITCQQSIDDNLIITFADNGIGVKDEDRRKVFTPFFTTKISSRKGTGLGLFVIQRIITEIHSGKIKYESKYAKGTSFIIKLPIAR
ncbi:MAG: ATP-binding protein, partial [Candidatus Omnitrophica bacterium]|nr:ATP-binding protein [Candidatus Omnitrophota bacterium]